MQTIAEAAATALVYVTYLSLLAGVQYFQLYTIFAAPHKLHIDSFFNYVEFLYCGKNSIKWKVLKSSYLFTIYFHTIGWVASLYGPYLGIVTVF
jgi:hypothetical protein